MIDFSVGKIATLALIGKFVAEWRILLSYYVACVGIATQLAEGVGVVNLSGTHLKVKKMLGQSIAFQTRQVI